ncbi:MAG: hypothetical protein J1F67_06625 [Muribaculaceae bacterium]|nr:hypothetical protein [Muribaculaceae bacterium]
MSFDINIPEIGAEMMLNYLYPELEERWIVRNEGTFYRNYNNDALSVDTERPEISLARDGFLKLLPQGFISSADELQSGDKKEKHKEIERRKRVLQEAFLPFDTVSFRRKLKIEREISQLLNDKLEYILKTYFGIEYKKIENTYVKEWATLLPYISIRRADFGLIKNILQSQFECKVIVYTGRYSRTDSTKKWIPLIRYELLIEKLDNENYKNLSNQVETLREFLAEWFIPAEMKCEIMIKDYSEKTFLNNNLTLDYNTRIN